MALVLNEDEVMLRDMAEGFFADKAPVTALRELRDMRDETGFDRALWSDMAEMGFTGVVIDEDHGGVDMGFMAAGLIAEQMGRTSGEEGDAEGISLFILDPKAKGVSTERTIMVDSRNAARIDLDDVEVSGDALLGTLDEGMNVLSKVLNAGRAAVAAELLGAGSQAFETTVSYIKERKQFGKIIGEFQALQHRASHLYSEMEIARSAVMGALTALDDNDPKAELYCAMAKAKLGSVAKLASQEGVQMHGGVGMTDEYDIGLFMKRIRVLQELFGDAHYHMNQFALANKY